MSKPISRTSPTRTANVRTCIPHPPGRARKAVKSHMARAKWMGKVGYLLLAAGDRPGDGRDEAELLEFLQSIGITLAPRGGTGGDGRRRRGLRARAVGVRRRAFRHREDQPRRGLGLRFVPGARRERRSAARRRGRARGRADLRRHAGGRAAGVSGGSMTAGLAEGRGSTSTRRRGSTFAGAELR